MKPPADRSSGVQTTIAPWLTVADGKRAVDFYRQAFGAVDVYRLDGAGGAIAVARLEIDGAAFWVQQGDAPRRPVSDDCVRLILSVSDPDRLFAQAIKAGATEVTPIHEAHGWRSGRVCDPFGHDWELSRPLAARSGS